MKQVILFCLGVILSLTSARASEFQVNTRTSLSQANSDIATKPNGDFVVVWSSYYGSSSRSNDIFCCCFEPNCAPLNDEFQVNKTTIGNQTEPSIAIKSSGEFIVTWQGPGLLEEDGDDIYAQWLDANGVQIGEEFRVNDYVQDDQVFSNVVINESGSAVIVWESELQEEETNTTAIFCRYYDANGIAGDEFQVNIEPDCRYPDAAIDPTGNFTIVWIEGKRPNYSIMARLYDSNGTYLTEPFKVSTINISSFAQPVIAMNATGCFLITWDGDPNLARMDDIHARLYEPNGIAVGEPFIVNTTTENAQQNPQVAMNNIGEFIIVWDSEGDPNTNQKDIFGQRFNKFGEHIGDEFRLNSYTDSDQKCPAVGLTENGHFITVWQSQEQDGSSYGIFGESGKMIEEADFNVDGFVNFFDYQLLANEWRRTQEPLISDLIDDDKIDRQDLFAFCLSWLNPYYE